MECVGKKHLRYSAMPSVWYGTSIANLLQYTGYAVTKLLRMSTRKFELSCEEISPIDNHNARE